MVAFTAALVTLLVLACAFSIRERMRRHRLELELSDLRGRVRTDPDLMLRTREAFSEDLELELLRGDRTGRPACLVVFSLDEETSDSEEADARRRSFASVLRAAVRVVDVAYRTGIDEFALILPETRARGGLVAAARVKQAYLASAKGTVTAGLAETGPGIDRHRLFRNAYCALLSAGTGDRARLLAYSPELERSESAEQLPGLAEVEPVHGSHRPHR
jgi:GGDEF domain-containing protein